MKSPGVSLDDERPEPMRVLLVIRELGFGGAERQLVQLAIALKARGASVSVAVFYPCANRLLANELEAAGMPPIDLAKRGRWDLSAFLGRTRRLMARARPDIVYSFLPLGNVVSLIANSIRPKPKIVWGQRCSSLDPAHLPWTDIVVEAMEATFAFLPDLTISNSMEGASLARRYGHRNVVFVPNGFDTVRFMPRPEARARLRAEWGLPASCPVIGLVGKLNPMKDYTTFLQGAAILGRKRPDARLVWVGNGTEDDRHRFWTTARDLGVASRVSLLPARHDVETVYNAFDVSTLTSAFGEGTPNVVGEAMACGIPCVVTDVGESRLLVGSTGRVIRRKDPVALAAAWHEQLDTRGPAICTEARQRIEQKYSISGMLDRTLVAFRSVLRDRAEAPLVVGHTTARNAFP